VKARSLRLRKETLAELGTDDLAAVAGAGSTSCVTYTVVPTGCWCTGIYPSLNVPCHSVVDCIGTVD
jgi:hypothetical protein